MSDSKEPIALIVENEENGSRLDTFIRDHQPEITRSAAEKWIQEGCVTVNAKEVGKATACPQETGWSFVSRSLCR